MNNGSKYIFLQEAEGCVTHCAPLFKPHEQELDHRMCQSHWMPPMVKERGLWLQKAPRIFEGQTGKTGPSPLLRDL